MTNSGGNVDNAVGGVSNSVGGITGAGDGTDQAMTIYGQIPTQTAVGAGDYKDFQNPQIDPYAFNNGAAIPVSDDNGTAALALVNTHLAAAAQDTTTAVRPSDAIRLSVWRQPEFTGEFPIAPDGTILHPLLAQVRVVGRTREQVRAQLREVLLQYERDPQFVFDYLYRVGVTGEVRLPNLYNLPPETTIGQAVAAAGGVAEYGRLDRVRLMRGGGEVILDLRNPSPEVAEMRIRSGDQIRVQRRGAGWRASPPRAGRRGRTHRSSSRSRCRAGRGSPRGCRLPCRPASASGR